MDRTGRYELRLRALLATAQVIAVAFLAGAAFCYAFLRVVAAMAKWDMEREHREKVERNRREYERQAKGWPDKT